MTTADWVAVAGFIAMFVLMGLRVPLGVAMGLVGIGTVEDFARGNVDCGSRRSTSGEGIDHGLRGVPADARHLDDLVDRCGAEAFERAEVLQQRFASGLAETRDSIDHALVEQ